MSQLAKYQRNLQVQQFYFSQASTFSTFALVLQSSQSFLKRIKRMILKRIVVFRLLFYGTLILTLGTFLQANKAAEGQQTVTPSFFSMHSTLPGQRFKLSGVVKSGSIEIKKGTLENKFVMTDFKNEIVVLFKGALPPTFREGDMATLGGFLADHKNPTSFIATSVQSNHEITPDKWLGETSLDKVVSINMIESTEDFEYTKMK
eukprot:403375237